MMLILKYFYVCYTAQQTIIKYISHLMDIIYYVTLIYYIWGIVNISKYGPVSLHPFQLQIQQSLFFFFL